MSPNVQDAIGDFLVIFESIVIEALPFIVIGALISGTLEELLPQQMIARLMPRRRFLAVAGSALLGLVFPMCECGIVPVMRRLLGKGLPLSCAVAYMLAAPIINPVVIASTWAAFSGDRTQLDGFTSLQMVTLRVGLAFITACTVGLIVEYRARKLGTSALIVPPPGAQHQHHHEHTHAESKQHDHHHHEHEHAHAHEHGPDCNHGEEHEHEHHDEKNSLQELPMHVHDAFAAPETKQKTWLQRLTSISETALHDFIDIACFLVIGAFLAALVRTLNVLDHVPNLSSPIIAAPAMMALAIVLCLCSEADAFVAANLVQVPTTPGAAIIQIPLAGKIAFLVLGPMLDIKLFLMYTRVFRAKLIWTIIPCVIVMVLVLSLLSPFLYKPLGIGMAVAISIAFLFAVVRIMGRFMRGSEQPAREEATP